MDYKINIGNFEGPLDLLLFLIKQKKVDIFEINIFEIINEYLNHIKEMEKLNLNIASEFLIMAAELIVLKSAYLLPNPNIENDSPEDIKQNLINRLLEYEQYKKVSFKLNNLFEQRSLKHSKFPSDLNNLVVNQEQEITINNDLDDLVKAFNSFLLRIKDEKPPHIKVVNTEYSLSERTKEIKEVFRSINKIEFTELFVITKQAYIIITFLSILELSKKQFLNIIQENNFQKIYLIKKEVG